MLYKQENNQEEMDRIIESLEKLRRFTGAPEEFWPAFLNDSVRLAKARLGVLMVRGEEGDHWKTLSVWPSKDYKSIVGPGIKGRMEEIAQSSLTQGCAWENAGSEEASGDSGVIMGVRIDLEEDKLVAVAVFFLENAAGVMLEEVVTRLKLVADILA